MDSYIDITVLPDPEFSAPMLMSALFAKLHRAFVALENKHIGISFPRTSEKPRSLGNVMRLHGTHDQLAQLQSLNWMKGLCDYTDVSSLTLVPINAKFCRVQRVQVKSNVERLRRRYQKRHVGVTEADVRGILPESVEKESTLPFLRINSDSTGQRFLLFIAHSIPTEQSVPGEFNCYGMSAQATVPWF